MSRSVESVDVVIPMILTVSTSALGALLYLTHTGSCGHFTHPLLPSCLSQFRVRPRGPTGMVFPSCNIIRVQSCFSILPDDGWIFCIVVLFAILLHTPPSVHAHPSQRHSVLRRGRAPYGGVSSRRDKRCQKKDCQALTGTSVNMLTSMFDYGPVVTEINAIEGVVTIYRHKN